MILDALRKMVLEVPEANLAEAVFNGDTGS